MTSIFDENADEEWVVHEAAAPLGETASEIPIIALWQRLLVPLQGDIRDTQVDSLEQRLLHKIRDEDCTGLIIDVSGVSMLDSHLCATLGRMAGAARLMGVPSVLCGLSPTIAMTLEAMGFDLEQVETALGLEAALTRLGVQVLVTDIDESLAQAEGENSW